MRLLDDARLPFREPGPSRVLGPQRVRRRVASVLAADRRHVEQTRARLAKLDILVSRCLRLRDLSPAERQWCQDVYDKTAVSLVASARGAAMEWAARVDAQLIGLAESAAELLPVDRDPRPARTQRKRRRR